MGKIIEGFCVTMFCALVVELAIIYGGALAAPKDAPTPALDYKSFQGLALLAALAALYLIPFIVARARAHSNLAAIGALNLLLGWTFLGWALALVWALARPPAPARS